MPALIETIETMKLTTNKKKRPRFGGFSTAAEVLASGSPTNAGKSDAEDNLESSSAEKENAPAASNRTIELLAVQGPAHSKEPDIPFQVTLTLVGTKFYVADAITMLPPGTSVLLERQPDNEFDPNALRVVCLESPPAENSELLEAESNANDDDTPTRPTIGHVSRQQAALLAPYLDARLIQFRSVTIQKTNGDCSSYDMNAEGLAIMSEGLQLVLDDPLFQKIADVDGLSKGLAALDLEEARKAHYSLEHLPNAIPWSPLPEFSRNNAQNNNAPSAAWDPFDTAAVSKGRLTVSDVAASQHARWPPSEEVMKSLGMAPADDGEWWSSVAGLKAPVEWNVSGAVDLLGIVKVRSQSHRDKAAQELDGAVHGVTNAWLDDTLAAVREAMHEPAFWCHRGGDAFIRAFGGPYVLGQEEGKLKLVRGAPHTELTAKICRAHNLVYMATHLTSPVGPGFNTIIFGLNLRRAGFHYHQDSIGELKPKNAPLLPRQPVVTTVFYEHPSLDNEKEVVLWRPMLNWSALEEQTNPQNAMKRNGEQGMGNRLYLAARCVSTKHGMIHVQRAGLQARTKHGIFHAPGNGKEANDDGGERKGYRVAITARITWPDAEEKLEPFLKCDSYAKIFGPEGEWQLPKYSKTVG